ncbi:tetratricopeptide repeat protein 28-like [Watersipora subatra]|uniref:tetratricopeptide repeat protein 28-like n=1 Tax=Watersipora subatra TaxID=2589382 RepID=UPI00355C66DD
MSEFPYVEWLARNYKSKGEESGSWRDYVQAHGLANFCVAEDPLPERHKLVYEIEESWYKGNHPLSYDEHQELIRSHEKLLHEYREKTNEDFELLIGSVKELETDNIFSENSKQKSRIFCKNVFETSEKCTEGLIKVSRRILETSVTVLKRLNEECDDKFVVIALGSIAKGEATPYSDLEYGIIVENNSNYFERLAVDSYFRIGNLKETPLKAFDIQELIENDYLDHQISTDNMFVGYRIDGITQRSGNIPTGNGKGGYKLTFTVDELMTLYQKEAEKPFDSYAADKSDMLSSTAVILANESISDPCEPYRLFQSAKRVYENSVPEKKNVLQKRLQSFQQDMNKYSFLPEFTKFQPPENRSVKVKEKLFRYPTLLANNLKMCLQFDAVHCWKVFSTMREKGLLSHDNHDYLNILLASSIYIRTSAYLKLKAQAEFIHVADEQTVAQNETYIAPPQLILTMGCLLAPIKQSVKASVSEAADSFECLGNTAISSICAEVSVTKNDHWVKSEVLYFMGKYSEAKEELGNAISKSLESSGLDFFFNKVKEHAASMPDGKSFVRKNTELCAYVLYYTGNYCRALQYFMHLIDSNQASTELFRFLAAHCYKEIGNWKDAKKMLPKDKKDITALADHRDISTAYFNIGQTYLSLGEHSSALEFLSMALNKQRSVHGETAIHSDIARSYLGIGNAHHFLGDYKTELEYYTKSLDMWKAVYGETATHSGIATSYHNVGIAYQSLGNYREALKYFTKSLDMKEAVYGETALHSDIACSYTGIGNVNQYLGNYKKALEYYTKSLDMWKAVYGETATHSHIASSYLGIGTANHSLGNYEEALLYFTKSLDMWIAVHGETATHSNIAYSYNSIGTVYHSLGVYRAALEYHTKSLNMMKAVHGETASHSDIAGSYYNTGNAYFYLSDYTTALEYYTKSLDMRKAVYGETATHADIADSYNCIGKVNHSLGDYRAALEYHTQSLEMMKAVYGETAFHPDIAHSYHIVGKAYHSLGEYSSALDFYTKSLDMMKVVYRENSAHCYIQQVKRDIESLPQNI